MLKLELPNETHRKMYEDMMKEWRSSEITPTSPSLLFYGDNYGNFLEYILELQKGNIQDRTQSSLYFGIEDGKIIGAIDIRHHIDHPGLRETGGHIGYGIRPSGRRKGYATEMLRLGLNEARNLGIDKILISCEPNNIASEKVILKNGGVYNKTVQDDTGVYKSFWITL